MRRGTGLALIFGLSLLAGGCAPAPDPDQMRLCRIALVALAEPDAQLAIVSETPVAAERGSVAIQVTADARNASGSPSSVMATCRFAADGPSGPDSLSSLRFGSRTLSGPELFFLKRFWLGSPAADGADPQPVALWRAAPDLPLPIAHGLQTALAALPGMAVYGLLAAAYSLVYGLVGRINLAFGAFAAIGGAACLTGVGFLPHPSLFGLVGAGLVAALWAGAMHGVGVSRWVFLPLGRATGQQGLVATVGLSLVLGEYLRLANGSTPLWITPLRATPLGIARAGSYVVTLTPLAMVVTGGFAAGCTLILLGMARSQFGRDWRAMADDPRASALMGVDPVRTFELTFALAASLAAVAGAVTVLVYGSFGNAFGTVLGLKALLAAVLGGIGSVPGAFIGGIAIALFEATWSVFLSSDNRDLALFVGLSVILIVRPGGLLGYRDIGPRTV